MQRVKVNDTRELLETAARRETTVSFPQLFSLFSEDDKPSDVYNTLEAACVEICDWKTAIYSVLLAKKDSGLPGDGFFDIFRNHRADSYWEISGGMHVAGLDPLQRRKMTELERRRVYLHAKSL
jgi:hypothetical protein